MNTDQSRLPTSEHVVKGRNQCLSQPERKRELGASHQKLSNWLADVHLSRTIYARDWSNTYLGNQSLEEGREALVPDHLGQDTEPTLRVVEVLVLDTGLDDVERSRHDQRGRRTSNGGNKVLEPRGLVVILETEDVLLGERGTTEELVELAQNSPMQHLQETLTANEPGALRAAVQPQPRYNPKPSSLTILRTPRPLKASGFVWRLILRTSRGSRTISPIPIRDPAAECMMAFPVFLPKAFSNWVP